MANIKSAIKRIRTTNRNEKRNKAIKSSLKTSIKSAKSLIVSKGKDIEKFIKIAIVNLDKAVSKGVLHKNAAAKKKSRLMKTLNNSLKK